MSTSASAQEVVFILSDVDGVLTDGGIIYDNQGIETKRFHTATDLVSNSGHKPVFVLVY